MLAGAQPGARGCSYGFREVLASGRGYTSRLQLFVDALVHEFGAFIEIFVRAAFFGPHPAFTCCARVRHGLGICDGRRLSPRRFCVRPGRSDRSGGISCCRHGGVSLASGECQRAGGKQYDARSKKIAELYDRRLHLLLSEDRISIDGRPRGRRVFAEKFVHATASKRVHNRVRDHGPSSRPARCSSK
jgi:hypothetical protein